MLRHCYRQRQMKVFAARVVVFSSLPQSEFLGWIDVSIREEGAPGYVRD